MPGADRVGNGRLQQFGEAFDAFFVRWRLSGLAAAPYLPVPMQPLFGGELPLPILGQLLATRGLFFIPDTFPIPSRDQFRKLLEGVRTEVSHRRILRSGQACSSG